MGAAKAELFDASQARLSGQTAHKGWGPAWPGECVCSECVGYLFIFRLRFQKQKATSELHLLPDSPYPRPGSCLRAPDLLWALPVHPWYSPPPFPVPQPCAVVGLQRMNLLNYSPFHATEQFQRCHILLFAGP